MAFQLTDSADRAGHFWLTLLTLVFAQVLNFSYMVFTMTKVKEPHSPFPAFTGIGSAVFLYNVAVFVSMFLFWIYLEVSLSWYITIHLLNLLIFVVGGGFSSIFLMTASNKEMVTKNNVNRLKNLVISVEDIIRYVSNLKNKNELEDLANSLEKLRDKLRYSDPETGNEVSVIEEQIENHIDTLVNRVISSKEHMVLKNQEDICTYIQSILDTVDKRNSVLSSIK
ncbi:hypothetical protein HYG86_18125 [Alkalicella caledoniensis]|uniref:Uncharacterized protein n=1 Tax=Alkalicella caledoniensis TaxID=2731377 RepID=A0A7G9WCZ1_ALKCA|nr:hypothetical protein [Alkalicella caledoniensis]QNO16553.1 hypothetical protein HYG86_18125 [Alkalicella caledoniensis]